MDIITDEQLIERIEAFLADSGMKPSRFGLETMGDGALLPQLREGRSLSLKNVQKVLCFIAEYPRQPTQASAA